MGPKLKGYAFANFGKSSPSGTEEDASDSKENKTEKAFSA